MESMKKRKPISKSKRFRIFSRDKFRCRYCGLESDRVTLVVDHIIPVAKGGTDDDSNLLTSCEDCNQGKSAKELGKIAPTVQDERLIQQEMREQIAQAKIAKAAAIARSTTDSMILEFWGDQFGDEHGRQHILSHMRNLVGEFGVQRVFSWIEIAAAKAIEKGLYTTASRLRYIHGIKKKCKEGEVK